MHYSGGLSFYFFLWHARFNNESRGNESVLLAGVRPLRLVILSKRAVPPSLILASRRSRRRRAALWAGDSSAEDIMKGIRTTVGDRYTVCLVFAVGLDTPRRICDMPILARSLAQPCRYWSVAFYVVEVFSD
jgi:hypothetical protein